MILRDPFNIVCFDQYQGEGPHTIQSAWNERLFGNIWTLDPSIFDYTLQFRPPDFIGGVLATSWEFSDSSTLVVHLRQGVKWQNIAPSNGREFVASDVTFNFNRLFGLGDGFTKPAPFWTGDAVWSKLTSVTATEKYTVVFKWSVANPELILENMEQATTSSQCIQDPDVVKMYGDTNDWHHAIGTGPFILTDFVSGGSATLIANPNYWGYDERYPQNKLPYIDTLKILVIPDAATALSAMRTGKIDGMEGVSIIDANSMAKSNPSIVQITYPKGTCLTLDIRNDVKPFSDIRVRQAMQMAINLPAIASGYYLGTCPSNPSTLTSNYMTGYGFPYSQWPQDLKDQYAFNPTAAKKLLADAGYPAGFNTDIVVAAGADLDLIQIAKSNLADIGVNMDIRPMDSVSWTAFVLIGHKQDGLAAQNSGKLGYTYQPTLQGSTYLSGQSANYTMVSDPVYDALNAKAVASTSLDDFRQVLKDMNEQVARQHYVISLLQPNLFSLHQPWLKGYTGQIYAFSGNSAGLSMLGYDTPRFWIDQNLKK